MKTAALASILFAGAAFAAGGQDPEKFLRDSLQSLQDVNTVLNTVKDKASAEAAVAKLDEPSKRLLAIMKLPCPRIEDPVLLAKLDAMYGKQIPQAGEAFEKEVERLWSAAELQKILARSPEWAKLSQEVHKDIRDRPINSAKLDIRSLELAATAYFNKHGNFPKTLKAMAEKQADGSLAIILPQVLTDPWGKPYQYDPAKLHPTTGKPLIWSDGPDPKGKIANWEVKGK